MHSCASRCYVGIKWCVHRKHKKVNVMYFNNFSTCLDLVKSSFCHLIEVSSLKGMQILVVPMFIQVAFNRPLVHAFFISTWLQHSTPCCTSWTTWTKKKKKKDHAGLPVWSVCRGNIFFDITCVYCLDASRQWKLVSCLCALYFRTVAVFVCKSEFATALAFIGSASQACPLQVGSLPVCHLLHACHEVWEEHILCSQLNTSYKCQQTMPWTH